MVDVADCGDVDVGGAASDDVGSVPLEELGLGGGVDVGGKGHEKGLLAAGVEDLGGVKGDSAVDFDSFVGACLGVFE